MKRSAQSSMFTSFADVQLDLQLIWTVAQSRKAHAFVWEDVITEQMR